MRPMTAGGTQAALPSALERLDSILSGIAGRPLGVFLDYDGTLTPIVERPQLAELGESMRGTLRALAARATVAVISGRDLPDLERRVAVEGICYAGSHGFDIAAPRGARVAPPLPLATLLELDAAERALRRSLGGIDGALVERKRFSIAAHYRQVRPERVPAVHAAVDRALRAHPSLRRKPGKMVHELLPDIAWDKGAALRWLLQALGLGGESAAIYIGDDETDEDAFCALGTHGIGIAVQEQPRATAASYALGNTDEVELLLGRLATLIPPR